MKRSRKIDLVLLLSAAAALSDCGRTDRRCVDRDNIVTDPSNCANSSPDSYHWYYGGTSGSTPVGAHVTGGSTDPSSATTRGVFGGEGAAHAGGGGEGAGE